jgi:hypothetical protein
MKIPRPLLQAAASDHRNVFPFTLNLSERLTGGAWEPRVTFWRLDTKVIEILGYFHLESGKTPREVVHVGPSVDTSWQTADTPCRVLLASKSHMSVRASSDKSVLFCTFSSCNCEASERQLTLPRLRFLQVFFETLIFCGGEISVTNISRSVLFGAVTGVRGENYVKYAN